MNKDEESVAYLRSRWNDRWILRIRRLQAEGFTKEKARQIAGVEFNSLRQRVREESQEVEK